MEKLTLEMAQHLFIRNRTLKNLSPDSIVYYNQKFRKMNKLFEELSLPNDVHIITHKHVDEATLYMLEEQHLAVTTVLTYLRAWKALFNFLYREDLVTTNIAKRITMPKARRTIIKSFTDEQIIALFKQPNTKTFTGVRDLTIMMLFLETGVRLRELTEIKVEDIDWSRNSIKVRGKGDKDRFVYFQDRMRAQLLTYVRWRGSSHTKELFIASGTENAMKRREIEERIQDYGVKAGISEEVRVSPHTFRHTFARMCVQNKAGLFPLQQMLGHSTLNQVLTYVNLFSDEIRNAHAKSSPLENLNKKEPEADDTVIPFKKRTKRTNVK